MATVKELSDGGPDGSRWGQSTTDKIGFYGIATPIAQPSTASQDAVTATALGTIDFTSATEAATVVAAVNELKVLSNALRDALVDLNLIKGGS